jgi:hypothetical protein
VPSEASRGSDALGLIDETGSSNNPVQGCLCCDATGGIVFQASLIMNIKPITEILGCRQAEKPNLRMKQRRWAWRLFFEIFE